jgi:hypothetical protein
VEALEERYITYVQNIPRHPVLPTFAEVVIAPFRAAKDLPVSDDLLHPVFN